MHRSWWRVGRIWQLRKRQATGGGGGNGDLEMDDYFYQRDVLWWVYQLIRFLLGFDKRKIKNKTSKTNMYIVFDRNYFCYCGSPKFPAPLNPYVTFTFEENSCQSNSFLYCGYPTLPVPLKPNPIFPFEEILSKEQEFLSMIIIPLISVPIWLKWKELQKWY